MGAALKYPAPPVLSGTGFPTVLRQLLQQRFGPAASAIEARWHLRFGGVTAKNGLTIPERHEEYQDLLELLLEHAGTCTQEVMALAHWLAFTCMGSDHLWEDLGLPERPALTALIRDYFPALHAKNTENMRWKRFFYKQLCARAGLSVCRSPSCAACSEYSNCFIAPITV
jgi:nitrogen fixation protein NifQ